MLTAILILLIIVVVGQQGVQRTGNYENIWGTMFWWGLILLVLAVIIKVVLLAFMIPL